MSVFSSVSKGQTSKEGWKSCSLSRHLVEEPQLTGGCLGWPLPHRCQQPHPLQQQLQAMYGGAVGGREVVPELAQQPQRELGEGREAVGQALLLGAQGPLELIPRVLPRGGAGESAKLCPRSSLQPHCPLPAALSNLSLHSFPWGLAAPMASRLHHPLFPLLCLCSAQNSLCCSC